MSPPTINSNNSKPSPGRHSSVDRFSTLRTCDPCRRRKRRCNGQKPCLTCKPSECVYYSVIPDQPRGVFSINPARRLSSGSACETCRRRKTKCDGSNPCAFCAANHLKCVNNTERRKRTSISATPDHEAMDRIEDRLRRIEQLMTVFSPSPLSQSFVRQQRHSVQGITVAKEQIELQLARRAMSSSPPQSGHSSSDQLYHAGAYITPPNSGGKKHQPSPPPTTMIRQVSNQSQPLLSSMLNLTLSPSSSTSSSSSSMHLPQSSLSTPLSDQINYSQQRQQRYQQRDFYASNPLPPMPSLMDQLSNRTFITSQSDYPVRSSYPIYPLCPSPPAPPTTTFAEASFSP